MIITEPQICRIPMTRRSVGRQIESENRGATYPSGTYRNGRAKRLGLEILVACEGRASLSGVSCRGLVCSTRGYYSIFFARVVPYPVRAVKALGQRYLSRAACEKTADVCGSPRRRLRVVGMIHIY